MGSRRGINQPDAVFRVLAAWRLNCTSMRLRISNRLPAACLLLILACMAAGAGSIDLGPRDAERVVVFDNNSPIATSAANRLTDYLRNLTGKPPALRREPGDAARAIVIGDPSIAK